MVTSPKRCLSGHSCEPETLAEALYCLCHHSRIPLKQIAEAIGKRAGYLADAANPDLDTVAFQAVALVPAMRAAQNFVPLQFQARQCGFVLVRLPDGGSDVGDIRQRFMKAVKELGDVSNEVERALTGDDEIDQAEYLRIDRELSEASEALEQMRAAVSAKVKGRVA